MVDEQNGPWWCRPTKELVREQAREISFGMVMNSGKVVRLLFIWLIGIVSVELLACALYIYAGIYGGAIAQVLAAMVNASLLVFHVWACRLQMATRIVKAQMLQEIEMRKWLMDKYLRMLRGRHREGEEWREV